ncbi:MAG: hypothetical protein PHY18_05610 [Dehalococcoidales bacterium]|nr:hypothetical protein [Dehalococcoidales bacterium]
MGLSESQKANIWSKMERQTGWQFNKLLRQTLEKEYQLDDPQVEEDDMKDAIVTYVKLKEADTGMKQTKAPRTSKRKMRPRSPNKRLYLIGFVISNTKAIGQDTKPAKWYILGRINWKGLSQNWNKAHAFDPVTAASLKSRFHHAIVDPDVQKETIVMHVVKKDLLPSPAEMYRGVGRIPYEVKVEPLQPGEKAEFVLSESQKKELTEEDIETLKQGGTVIKKVPMNKGGAQ